MAAEEDDACDEKLENVLQDMMEMEIDTPDKRDTCEKCRYSLWTGYIFAPEHRQTGPCAIAQENMVCLQTETVFCGKNNWRQLDPENGLYFAVDLFFFRFKSDIRI